MGLESGGAGRIGVLAANSLDYAVVVIACQFAGLTITPLPVLVTPDAQARMIDDAAVAVLFPDAACATAARSAAELSRGNDLDRPVRDGRGRGPRLGRVPHARPPQPRLDLRPDLQLRHHGPAEGHRSEP